MKTEIRNGVHILKKDIKKLHSKALNIISGYDYPKLTALIICIVLAYILFSNDSVQDFMIGLNSYGYLGAFIAGMFFTFGFTSPFSAGFFITLNPSNIYLAAILGGAGAVIFDLLIFKIIRFSFIDEFEKLKNEKVMRIAKNLIDKTFGKRIQIYLMYAIAGLLIASPLPDEIGVIMLAGLTRINAKVLAVISFVMNGLGIFVLLLI